jgi:hypothetical protein
VENEHFLLENQNALNKSITRIILYINKYKIITYE